LTCAVPFKILETVLGETPAFAATMLRVALIGLVLGVEVFGSVMAA
jgi:hypothetical protein